MGDWYHSCPCLGERDEKQIANYNKTIARLDYIRSHNYKINVIWECEYRKELRKNDDMKKFINESLPVFYKKKPKCVTQDEILEAVMKEELFGFIECDIRVPDD